MSRYRLATFAFLLSALTAAAQVDRRSRDEPEMFIEAGGRSGTCDALVFSPDGKYLYAGGDDKVVRAWEVGRDGLDAGTMRTFRWPVWREQRGGIKALGVHPTDGSIVVGGYGLKNSLVVLIDANGEIRATNDVDGKWMHSANVMVAAFVPDGKSVVYGTSDGKLWSWDLAHGGVEIGAHPLPAGKEANRPRLIRFLDANTFLSASQFGDIRKGTRAAGRWTVTAAFSVLDLVQATVGGKPPAGGYEIYRADVSADRAWLACAVDPEYLFLCTVDGKTPKAHKIPSSHVRSLAFGPTGTLAIAVADLHKSTFRLDRNDSIQLFDTPTGPGALKLSSSLSHTYRAEAMAWHPDGRLAVAGGDNHEVTLWTPGRPDAPVSVVRGKGRCLWDVRVGKKGESILFRPVRDPNSENPNERGKGPWVAFDYTRARVLPSATDTPVDVRTTEAGWSIEPSKQDRFVWQAVLRSGEKERARHDLVLDPNRDEQPRCYCFLPTETGQPTRVLVGHYYGFSVFALTRELAVREALYTGHAGDVTSIAADASGTWCVTAGADQMLTGWSLAPLDTGAFGAKLQVNGGKLIVAGVESGGPAWEMGLRRNDEIVLAAHTKGKTSTILYALRGKYSARTIDEDVGKRETALDALRQPELGTEYYLGWKRGEDVLENLSTVRRRPLWRFFPAFDENNQVDQWVAWIWKGGHYAASSSGDYLVGWQLNDVETITRKSPHFYKADAFARVLKDNAYKRPSVVLGLMRDRDLGKALRTLAGDNPMPTVIGRMEPAPPRLTPRTGKVTLNGLTLDIQVEARERAGSNPDLLPQRVELWVNDHRVLKKDNLSGKEPYVNTIEVPKSAFRYGENQVTLLTFNAAGGRGEDRVKVICDRKEQPSQLHGLLVGINKYNSPDLKADGTREFGPLNRAKDDAVTLDERWRLHAGADRLFTSAKGLITTLDEKAQRDDILSALDNLAKTTTPDDQVVVFLAGHGDFVEKKGGDRKEPPVFVYCCPNYTRAKWEQTGVTAAEVFDRLANCPARKMVLIDACRSGQSADAYAMRQFAPDGQGPVVITGCDQAELSFEDEKLGHGLFTAAVLEALGPQLDKADANHDGKLDSKELFAYVKTRLPGLLEQTGHIGERQNPQAFPPEFSPKFPRFVIARK
jgi:WD40 repeat protein